MKFVLVLVVTFFCLAITKAQTFKPDSVYTYTFPELSLPFCSQIEGDNKPTSLSFYLPAGYCAKKTYPLVLYIAGNKGGHGTLAWRGKEIFDTTSIITVNFPLYKENYEPLLADKSNFLAHRLITDKDADKIWENYSTLLDTLFQIIPNVDKKNTFMGGFSNGAHATAALINNHADELTKYFSNFYFIEGGANLKNLDAMQNCNLLFFKGGASKWNKLIIPYEKAKGVGINADFITMEGIGHAFPKEYYPHLIDWVKTNNQQ